MIGAAAFVLTLVSYAPTANANPLSDMASVAAGGRHTCGLTRAGGVKCWGWNLYGQLGDGGTCGSICYAPVDVVGLQSGIVAVAAGGEHTCAITDAGAVTCWGANGSGQLGNGTTTTAGSPVNALGLTSGVTALSAGTFHTCAITGNGEAWCWGWNGYGQLGIGTAFGPDDCGFSGGHCSKSPTQVIGLDDPAKLIAAGFDHTCAATSNGVSCWGDNKRGQVGDGRNCKDQYDHCTLPTSVSALGSGVTALAAGVSHTCALLSGGLRCWGNNFYGALGNGTRLMSTTPSSVAGLNSTVTSVSAGSYHSCALTLAGSVLCWGQNIQGELGVGDDQLEACGGFAISISCSTTPVEVFGLTSGVVGISSDRSGGLDFDGHTCATMETGGIKCWGHSYFGELGDGSQGDSCDCRRTPVDVLTTAKNLPPTFTPTATATQPGPHRKVLLITGISSSGTCGVGEAIWMEDFLTSTGWVQLTAAITEDDFMQFDYSSGNSSARGCGRQEHFAEFTNLDTCWSLDDSFTDALGKHSLIGQASRLAAFVDDLPADDRVTVITHSQGGVLIALAVRDYLTSENLAKIEAIVTLDSPLGGINSLSAPALQAHSGCTNLDPRYDSAYDMLPGSDTISRLATPEFDDDNVRLYTVNETGNEQVCQNLCQLIDDEHSRIENWEASHLQVYTGNHSTIWNGQGDPFGKKEESIYLGCAVASLSPPSRCEAFARGNETVSVSRGQTITQHTDVGSSAGKLTVLTAWPGSIVSTALISPSGRVIDGTTIAGDVVHRTNATAELYEVMYPESGTWQVRISATDVPDGGESVQFGAFVEELSTPSSTPTPAAAERGDANCDHHVNSIDAALVLQYVAGLAGLPSCPTGADADGNTHVDSIDAALILQYTAGLIGDFS